MFWVWIRMAALLLAAAGAGIGGALTQFSTTALMFGMSGMQLGWAVGGALGGMLFAPSQPNVTSEGSRISDLKISVADNGTPIPIAYGTTKLAGSIIWASDLIETEHKSTSGGGNKGGGGGEVTQISYTYSDHLAFAICESQDGRVSKVQKVLRIWANGDLIYDATGAGSPVQDTRVVQNGNLRIYLGGEDQMPDALIQAHEGVANVPAFRGLAYVVFEDFQLQKYGNRPPSITFEVCTSLGVGGINATEYHIDNTYGSGWVFNPVTGLFWDEVGDASPSPSFTLVDQTGTAVGTLPYHGNLADPPPHYNDDGAGNRRIFAANTSHHVLVWNADTGAFIRDTGQTISWNFWSVAPDGTLWKGTGSFATGATTGNLVQFNEAGSTLITYPLSAPGPTAFAFEGNSYVWFRANHPTDAAAHQIKRYNRTLGSVDFTYTESRGIGNWVYDPGRNSIWYSANSSPYTVVEFNLSTQSIAQEIAVNASTGSSDEMMALAIDPVNDLLWVSHYGLNTIEAFSRTSGTLIHSVDMGALFPDHIDQYRLDVVGGALWVHDGSGGYRWKLTLSPGGPQPIVLGNIVHDLNLRAGLQEVQINTTALTQLVRGYIVTRQMSARAGIEPLQSVWFFDGTESDAVMKYVNRGDAAIATISDDELGYGEV